jgi:DNA-directed RNA polymerase subunit RPC12/RpoP
MMGKPIRYCFEVEFDDEHPLPKIGPGMTIFGAPVTGVKFAALDDGECPGCGYRLVDNCDGDGCLVCLNCGYSTEDDEQKPTDQ